VVVIQGSSDELEVGGDDRGALGVAVCDAGDKRSRKSKLTTK
jgi:hypothetical protein